MRSNKPNDPDDKVNQFVASLGKVKAQFIDCARALEAIEKQHADFTTDAVLAGVPLQGIEVMRRFNRGELDEDQFFNEIVSAITGAGLN